MSLSTFNYCSNRRSLKRIVNWQCLQLQSILIWSVAIWGLGAGKLQAITKNLVSPELFENEKTRSALTEQIPPITTHEILQPTNDINSQGSSVQLHYSSKPPPLQMAAPENFNPGLRLPSSPPPPPPAQPSPPTASTPSVTRAIVLESITTDFHRDEDNFDQRNQFIEPTAQFRLRNGNYLRFKTGLNTFSQPKVDSVINIPLQVSWEGKINQVTLELGGGVDVFDHLPATPNLHGKVEVPIAVKVSPAGQLRSGVIISAEVEQGPYKFNAQTLDHQITAWRYGPSIYWQIDPKTSLYSSLHLGNYNDGNFEQQSFTRLERKLGQFSVAANLFNWSYTRDVEQKNGYFSPPDFLVYSGEVAFEGNVFKDLRCRIAGTLGQQRLRDKFDNAYGYQARCTAKLSPNVEADFGYAFSNVRNQNSGSSAYNNQSFTGQLRVRF